MTAAIDILLVALVLSASFGAFGFVRLAETLDRVHCVSFVSVSCCVLLPAIAFCADGLSSRALKVLVIALIGLLANAATSHATGRALTYRGPIERMPGTDLPP